MSNAESQTVDQEYYSTRKYQLRWWTLAVLSMSLVIIGLDNTILNVAIPTIQTDLQASASELQWMVDAYVLVFAGLLLTMGALGDRFGRKLTLQAGLVLFGVSSVFAAHADTSTQLIAARAAMGIGGALIMPSTLSIITDIFPREERGKAIGIWTGMAALGIATGPMTGGWLLENFTWGSSYPVNIVGDISNWGSVFLINIPIVIVALVAGLALVPREPRSASAQDRYPGGAAVDHHAHHPGLRDHRGSHARLVRQPWCWRRLQSPRLLAAVFIVWERRAEHPMLNLDFFKNPRFSAGAGAIMLAFFSLFGSIFIFTQYMQFVHGYTALEAGIRISPFALGMMVGAVNSHRLVRRFGTNKVAAAGLVIIALALATVAFWTPDTTYWIIGVTIVIMSFGVSNTMAPSTDAVMGAVPLAKAGVGSAMNDTTRQVGGAMGVAVIGSILNSLYTSRMVDQVAGLPTQAAGPAQDSVGAAVGIGAQMGGPAGQALTDAARASFVDGMHSAFLVAAVVALFAAVMVYRFMPAHHLGGQDHAGGE